MAFIDWLRRQQEESARNTRLFQGRPGTLRAGEAPTHEMVRASRAWGGGPGSGSGYQDRPGGESLMVRQPIRRRSPPPTSVTLTEGDDGSRKKVTKWEPEKQLKATALPSGPAMDPLTPIAPGRVNPAGSLDRRLDISRWGGAQGIQNQGFGPPIQQIANRVSPGMMARDPTWAGVPRPRPQTSIANVGMPDISNQRAMYHALRRPHPQVASTLSIPQQTQQNIWGSRFAPNPAPMIRKERNAPPVGMDEDEWERILARIHGGNY